MPPGIEPETVRLVAQCLNHYATPGPKYCCTDQKKAIVCQLKFIYIAQIYSSMKNVQYSVINPLAQEFSFKF